MCNAWSEHGLCTRREDHDHTYHKAPNGFQWLSEDDFDEVDFMHRYDPPVTMRRYSELTAEERHSLVMHQDAEIVALLARHPKSLKVFAELLKERGIKFVDPNASDPVTFYGYSEGE